MILIAILKVFFLIKISKADSIHIRCFFQTLRPYLSLPLLLHRLHWFLGHHIPRKGDIIPNDVTQVEKKL
jgi:hypothetical protein